MLKDILIVLAGLFIMLLFIIVFSIMYTLLVMYLENNNESPDCNEDK